MNLDVLLEAERRGILPADKADLLAEARRRGLVGGGQERPAPGPETWRAAREGTMPRPDVDTSEADRMADPSIGRTNLVEQAMSGVNEGIAQFVGTPVDVMHSGLNAGIAGVNRMTGAEIPSLPAPVGGSQMMADIMDPTISDVDPQTAAQRYARRVGQEVGFGVPASLAFAAGGPLSQAARANLPYFMAGNAAGDVAAGVGAQTAREVAPGNATAEIAAALLSGTGGALAFDRALRRTPPAPTRADIEKRTNDLYRQVDDVEITPVGQKRLVDDLQRRFADEGGDPGAYPKAGSQIRRVERYQKPTIKAVETARRRIRDHVARSADEGQMGRDLLDEVDSYLDTLAPGEVVNANPDQILDTLRAARASAHTGFKVDRIADAMDISDIRTERSGTGGNTLNNQTSEISKIYQDEILRSKAGKRGGYTPDEIAAMERIVFPSRVERNLQRVGRLAPTTGALQGAYSGMGGMAGLAVGAASGSPAYYLAAAPGAAGMIAQALAERMKAKNIDALMDTALRGGVKAQPIVNQGSRAAIISQIASRLQQEGPQ